MTSVFDPLRFGAVALDVLASGRATPDALAARQKARLSQLLAAAVRGSRLYRERLRGKRLGTALLSALQGVRAWLCVLLCAAHAQLSESLTRAGL